MTTQASPGLNIPSPYSPLPGIPGAVGMFPPHSNNASESTLASVSRGTVPINIQVTGPNVPVGSNTTNSLASLASNAGTNGSSSLSAQPGGSPNMGSPSNGPTGNPMNGGNPGAAIQQEFGYPTSVLTGLSNLTFTG